MTTDTSSVRASGLSREVIELAGERQEGRERASLRLCAAALPAQRGFLSRMRPTDSGGRAEPRDFTDKQKRVPGFTSYHCCVTKPSKRNSLKQQTLFPTVEGRDLEEA